MNALTMLKAQGLVDLKNIRRDSLLLWLPLAPLLLALLIRLGLPRLAALLQAELGFDLGPYQPLVMSFFMLMAPMMAGMIIGFLLLDERDDHVLMALRVTPLPPGLYLVYRLSGPLAMGVAASLVGYPIAGLLPLPLGSLLAVAGLASCSGVLTALFLAVFAQNKVAGLALVKFLNGLAVLPIGAYFIEPPWQWLAGVMPMYWPLKLFWLAAAGAPWGGYFAVGLLVNLVLLAALLRRFEGVGRWEG
jgi:fluoroquinolone transport system permease protein